MAEVGGIYKKIFNVQAQMDVLKKDKKNPHFKNTYVDINSILEALLPLLHNEKILLIQPTGVLGVKEENCLYTKLIDTEDNSVIEECMLLPTNLDAQKTGSALTYYRRYMLISLFGLMATDDDGIAGSNPVKEKTKPTEEMVLEMENLMNGDQKFKQEWLNFMGVKSFDKASLGQLEKAIKQIKGK